MLAGLDVRHSPFGEGGDPEAEGGGLQEQLGVADEFVFAYYFDYIGGTSTAAVIAAGLTSGRRAEELLEL